MDGAMEECTDAAAAGGVSTRVYMDPCMEARDRRGMEQCTTPRAWMATGA